MFIKVKGSRSMTYQYLTVDMIATAKEKGGFTESMNLIQVPSNALDALSRVLLALGVLLVSRSASAVVFEIRELEHARF